MVVVTISSLLSNSLEWDSPHHELKNYLREQTQEASGMKGKKFTAFSAQLISLFSEHGPSHHSWCSVNGSCYYLFIFAVYEVAYLNQICTTNCSSAPARGTYGKLDYCSQSSLLVTGLCIHTLFYARCISCEQSMPSTWLDLANGMSADMMSDFLYSWSYLWNTCMYILGTTFHYLIDLS